MTPRRIATIAAGVACIVVGDAVGGYAGASVIGLGIGVAIVGVGRREPFLFRGREEDVPDRSDGGEPWQRRPEW